MKTEPAGRRGTTPIHPVLLHKPSGIVWCRGIPIYATDANAIRQALAQERNQAMPLDQPIIEHLPAVQGDLTYLAPMADRPRTYTYDPGPGIPRSNLQFDTHKLPIHDMRPVAQAVSLEREGFALIEHHS